MAYHVRTTGFSSSPNRIRQRTHPEHRHDFAPTIEQADPKSRHSSAHHPSGRDRLASGQLRPQLGRHLTWIHFPEGWPELTPVGEVEIREYPTYRAAVVSEKDGRSGTTPMFRALFQHISTNDIPMTSPVDMTYGTGGSDRMSGMAFLYRTPELGPVGTDGVVRVEDVPPRAYASTGMRGSYSDAHHREGLGRVEAWIAAQPGWKADGPSRYLGYNSPFVPWFMRYGEVQVPVIPVSPPATTSGP